MDNPLNAFGFQPITYEEYHEQTVNEVNLLRARARVIPTFVPKKNPVGRPKSFVNVNDALVMLSDSSDQDERPPSKKPTSHSKRSSKYTNWFTSDKWPLIAKALKTHQFKVRLAVRYLKQKYGNPGMKSMFAGLNESTVRGWMMSSGRDFTPKVKRVVEAMIDGSGKTPLQVMHPGVESLRDGKEDLEREFVDLLKKLRLADIGINSLFVSFQMRAFLTVKCPELLCERGGKFEISRSYIRDWMQKRMNFTWRVPTSGASKLPSNWEELSKAMTLRIAYLVFARHIPEELVINTDQTGLLLLPVGNERTYAMKGSRDVTVSGRGDKRQVSLLMSTIASGDSLPVQVIFEGKTKLVVPKGPHAVLLNHNGWDLTFTENHWSSVNNMKEYVNHIYMPWVQKVCRKMDLDVTVQKSVLLLDCFSVHKSSAFRDWMKVNHPNICLLFVPGNCTSKLQPCDVVIQRPFKCAVHREFMTYAVQTMANQMQNGITPESAKLDTHVGALRNQLCEWMWKAWVQVSNRKMMIKSGWEKIGILKAWEKDTQMTAIDANDEGQLFSGLDGIEMKEEFIHLNDEDWFGDRNVDDLMVLLGSIMDHAINLDDSNFPDPESTVPQDSRVDDLHNFLGGPNGREVAFKDYLMNPDVISPYV